MREFWHEHKWEVILGLVFAVLFGVLWEAGKVAIEKAEHVGPERLAAGTVRVMTAVNLRTADQRRIAEEWKKKHDILLTPDFAALTMGSGFVVSEDGWLVTAAHVVRTKRAADLLAALHETPYIVVGYPENGGERTAKLVEMNDAADTALLRIVRPLPARYLVLGEAEKVERLDRVLAIGYPGSADYYSPGEPTMTGGEISKIGEMERAGRVFQMTAAIGPGNSGGPLIDAESRVIGVNVSIPAEQGAGIAFSVSIEAARKLLEKQKAKLPRAYEREGLLRQPVLHWTLIVTAIALLVIYFGIVLRAYWKELWIHEPGYGGFWVRVAATTIDAAIVIPLLLAIIVILIVATDRFLPWYRGVFAIVPLWWLYKVLCEWRWNATPGKRLAGLAVQTETGKAPALAQSLLRSALAIVLFFAFFAAALDRRHRALHDRIARTVVAIVKPQRVWKMLTLGMTALIVTLAAVLTHLAILSKRAGDDLDRTNGALWYGAAPNASTVANAIATRADRLAWMSMMRFPSSRMSEERYHHGLALMLGGEPRRAIAEFEAAAGDTWERLAEPGAERYSVVDYAAAKTGWAYFDLGDYKRAKQMFDYVLTGYSRDTDSLLGRAVTAMRTGDETAMRAAYAEWMKFDKRASSEIARQTARAPSPYCLTASQVAAVHELQQRMARAPLSPVAQSPRAPLR